MLRFSRRLLVSPAPPTPAPRAPTAAAADAEAAVCHVNLGQAFEQIRAAAACTASAQKALAQLLLTSTCPALASMLSDASKDETKCEVAAAAAAGYKACKQSLGALQSAKLKYPHACARAIDGFPSASASTPLAVGAAAAASLHPNRGPASASSSAIGVEMNEEVAISFVRPVAAAASSAAKDIEALQKSLDAIHFIQCNSNTRISSVLDAAYTAARALCPPSATTSPPSHAIEPRSQAVQMSPLPPHPASSAAASLPSKLIFKQPRAVPRLVLCRL